MTEWVAVRAKTPPNSKGRVIAVRIAYAEERSYWQWFKPNSPHPSGSIRAFREREHRDYDAGKGAHAVVALHCRGALVVRHSLVKGVLADALTRGEIAVRPVELSQRTAGSKPATAGVMEDDWILVDTLVRHPVDRSALEPSMFGVPGRGTADGAFDPSRPHASLVSHAPRDLSWSEGRAPHSVAFRLHELPANLYLEFSLYEMLNDALGGALEIGSAGPVLNIVDDTVALPPFAQGEAAAKRSFNALYRLLADSSRGEAASKRDQQAVLRSPIAATLLAMLVHRAPSADTRAAACQHPLYAAVYARDVDRAPRDDTRQAAAAAEASAAEYMRHVDRTMHPDIRETLVSSFRFKDYEREASQFAAAAPVPVRSAAGTRVHVPLMLADRKYGQVWITAADAPERKLTPAALPLARLVVEDPKGKKGKGLRKRIAKLNALGQGWLGPLILRRSLVEPLLGPLGAEQVTLLPVALEDGIGVVDADFVLLDVRAQVPLDREAAEATYLEPGRPNTSLVTSVSRFAYGSNRAPAESLFRVAEFPNVVMIEKSLLAELRVATGNAVKSVSRHDHLPMLPAIPIWDVGSPMIQKEEGGASSAAAYWRLSRAHEVAEDTEALRRQALQSPIYGYWIARHVDRAAKDDTRQAALAHPYYAALYARYVDAAPRDETRAAAACDAASAWFYANYVDIGLVEPIRSALMETG